MLSPEYYESCAKLILQQYADLEDAILRDIIRRLMKRGFVTDSAKWQAEMLQEAGLLYNDIVQEISDRTDACAEQVKTLFEDAGVQTVQIDNEIYREAGLVPVDIRQSPSMRQVLEAGYRKALGQLDNLTKTMPSAGQRLYINACNQAYMKVTSGAFSYQQAIMQAVRDTAASGMKMIQYDSGHADRVETAVRRAVLTGVGQTCREIGRMNAEENGCSLMEITAHSGARPEHAVWQGQLVDLTGRRAGEVVDGKRVLSLSAIGYGQITGFGGVNCRHDWYPYFEGISVPNYTAAQLKKLDARNISYNGEMYTQYEISQMQRAGERKVRAWKRRCITSQEAVKSAPDEATKAAAQAEYSKSAVKLKSAEQKLKDFCRDTGQDRDRFREQVVGFGRSEAQKAAQSNKKFLKFIDDNGIIDKEGFTSGYYRYLSKYPKSNLNYYTIDYKLKEAGIKKGTALPSEFQRAYILPDSSSKRDPYHIMYRMKERNITDDDLEMFMRESKVMFSQWNGQRMTFYSDSGVVTIAKSDIGWIYKTTWSKYDFDDETMQILEVINKYV